MLHRSKKHTLVTALFPLALLLCAAPAFAAVELSLPLEGYYRPGRYMPIRFEVQVSSFAPGSALVISADDAVPVSIDLSQGQARGIAPLLPLDGSLRELQWQVGQRTAALASPLRPLGVDQRLVGLAGVDAASAQSLFPGKSIIPLRLDPAAILPGPAAAWGTLDALLLDSASAGQLDDARIASLLASGTTLAVRAPTAPDRKWPWKQAGSFWLLTGNLAGPRSLQPDPLLFSAVQGWQADWPLAFRLRVLLYALIFSILMLAAALLRKKYTAWVGLLLSALAVMLLAWWWSGRAGVLQHSGDILIAEPGLTQTDTWIYRASAREAATFLPWSSVTWPVFEDFADGQPAQTILLCQADGQPRGFSARCTPPLRLGFLWRTIRPPMALPQPQPAGQNPLALQAQRLYLRPGLQVLGQLPAPPSPRSDSIDYFPPLLLGRALPLRTPPAASAVTPPAP